MIHENKIVKRALKIIERSVRETGEQFKDSEIAKSYCKLKIGASPDEKFMVIFLDNNNRWISAEILFTGTLNEAHVYPRAIIRRIIEHNAAKIILAHNHPSGTTRPSQADIDITKVIKDIVKVIDCDVLDHIIVTATETSSFAALNLL